MDNLPTWAWEPVTPRGVAAFARATFGRLLVVQFIVALLVAASVVWLLYDGFFPTVTAAIQRLPEAGQIRLAKLDWRGEPAQLLAEGRFVAFNVDLDHSGSIRSPAHIQIEFGRDKLLALSLLGYAEYRYPSGWIIAFNRPELMPKWGAWQPAWLAIAAIGVMAWLFCSWIVLATIYAGPIWLTAFFANRDLTLRGSWKLAGAALMPGALALAAASLAYDLAMLDLVQMTFVFGFHFVLGWIYAGISLLFVPRHPTVSAVHQNPFASTSQHD